MQSSTWANQSHIISISWMQWLQGENAPLQRSRYCCILQIRADVLWPQNNPWSHENSPTADSGTIHLYLSCCCTLLTACICLQASTVHFPCPDDDKYDTDLFFTFTFLYYHIKSITRARLDGTCCTKTYQGKNYTSIMRYESSL